MKRPKVQHFSLLCNPFFGALRWSNPGTEASDDVGGEEEPNIVVLLP